MILYYVVIYIYTPRVKEVVLSHFYLVCILNLREQLSCKHHIPVHQEPIRFFQLSRPFNLFKSNILLPDISSSIIGSDNTKEQIALFYSIQAVLQIRQFGIHLDSPNMRIQDLIMVSTDLYIQGHASLFLLFDESQCQIL